MTTIKPRPIDAASRRTGVDEPDDAAGVSPTDAPVHGGEAGFGATVARTAHQVMAARPDVFLRRLTMGAKAGVWAWERFGKKSAQVQSVPGSKLLADLARTAISETKLGGITMAAVSQSHQVVMKLADAKTAGQGVLSAAPTIAASPLGKIIPYLNALAVPMAATQLYQIENDNLATPFQKHLARTSMVLTAVASAASFTSNPVGWGVAVGVGALASVTDLALMATRNRFMMLKVYEIGVAKGEAMLKELGEKVMPR